jgi:hypothetical protein
MLSGPIQPPVGRNKAIRSQTSFSKSLRIIVKAVAIPIDAPGWFALKSFRLRTDFVGLPQDFFLELSGSKQNPRNLLSYYKGFFFKFLGVG